MPAPEDWPSACTPRNSRFRDVGLYPAGTGTGGRDRGLVDQAAGRDGRRARRSDPTSRCRERRLHAASAITPACLGLAGDEIWHPKTRSSPIAERSHGKFPLVGFYLQPAVGGVILSAHFWRRFASIDNVIAIKIAPFNRYRTLDVLRGVAAAGAPRPRRALYRQ